MMTFLALGAGPRGTSFVGPRYFLYFFFFYRMRVTKFRVKNMHGTIKFSRQVSWGAACPKYINKEILQDERIQCIVLFSALIVRSFKRQCPMFHSMSLMIKEQMYL